MFEVVWDREHNAVRLTNRHGGEALAVSPRPVFHEELNLLGLDKMGWQYPESEAPLLWACERRYFYRGELVMEVKGGNIFDAPTVHIEPNAETLHLQPVDMEHLRRRNEDALFILEHEATNFINDTYRKYKGLAEISKKNPDADFQALATRLTKKTKNDHVVVKEDCDSFDIMPLTEAERQGKSPVLTSKVEIVIASFSGGKDSQVVLDLVSRVLPAKDFLVIYSDTGYELPTSLQLYKEMESSYTKQLAGLRFYTAKNHQPVLYYWDEMDSPSRIHRWCCAVMKTAPLYRLLKEIHGTGKQPYVMAFEGVRAEESERRASYDRIGKGVKHGNVLNVRPIFGWNTTEVWLYLFEKGLPINIAYRKGLNRVGCVVCPLSSELGDCLDNKFFPETAKPFIDKLRENTKKAGIRNAEEYIKQRKWKVRAGGNNYHSNSHIEYEIISPDFKAILNHPKENIMEWLKTLGRYNFVTHENQSKGTIEFDGAVYSLILTFINNEKKVIIEAKNAEAETQFISHLKRILCKTTYCVHCEVCEVECPTGALSVVPFVKIDENKCVKCRKCLNFIEHGCEVANSIKKTTGIKTTNNMKNERATINRYNTFGLREVWLSYYFSNYETYFGNGSHGLNVKKQLPVFTKWITDAGILLPDKNSITETGKMLARKYETNKLAVWEIIWINLCNNTDLCAWYIGSTNYLSPYNREDIDSMFSESFAHYTGSVRDNSMKAFLNTLKESPLGDAIPIGRPTIKGKNVVSLTRIPYSSLSLAAVAYSLFRYAEKQGRYSLTVSEFYHEKQTEGIHRQFGIEREALERKLRSLQEEDNHVLSVELNMGLDNIILRDDLKAIDILKMLL